MMTLDRLESKGFELTVGTNHLGHFLLCNLLLKDVISNPSGAVSCSASHYKIARHSLSVTRVVIFRVRACLLFFPSSCVRRVHRMTGLICLLFCAQRIVVTASQVHDPSTPGGNVGSKATLGDMSGLEVSSSESFG